ncbi:MAG TPA: hypothetical protein VFW63_10825 [Acidimicrobiales bacterium]|nr:hypothetical protein [Acidimicrobiales bacterium]
MDAQLDALRREAAARGWSAAGDSWVKASADGSEQASVRLVGGDFEVRVTRHPTGPSPGPDPELAHGPRVFESCAAALDDAEAHLGVDVGEGGVPDAPGSGVVGPAADDTTVPEPNEPG